MQAAGEGALEGRKVAVGHGESHVLQRQGGGIAHAGPGILQSNLAARGPGAHVVHQLLQLAPGELPVAAQVGGEIGTRLGRGPQARRGQHLVDQGGQVAALVAIAGQGRARRRALQQPPQARPGRQVPGLHDHQSLARRRGEKILQQRGQAVAGLAHPHRPPPPGQRERGRLVGQPGRVLL